MNGTERAMIHDALAEAVAEHTDDPTPERLMFLSGVRHVALLLGMPEGRVGFDWPTDNPEARKTRRLGIIRAAAAVYRRQW